MKEPFSTQIPGSLRARARATVKGMKTVDPSYSLSQLVTDAVRAHVAHLEQRHHHGHPWPTVAHLDVGRRPLDDDE
ncbi:hypothetical protein GCM10009763_19710 [Dermacoccus profundi]|uniref:Uncharacterized protein n=3 Tax=Dermacoccaceae TaxID=145357 RepID=A0A417Z1L0_9MICO|nr:hypothetical protein [Dermacoccus abyssi]RHW44018.1 hypothetical protein D1832_13760 [Dermacoccus abyssi]